MECEKALRRLCSAHLFVLREYPSTQSLTYLSNVSLSLSLQHLINSSTRFNEAAGKASPSSPSPPPPPVAVAS